jgi:RHS repeat-associated protein
VLGNRTRIDTLAYSYSGYRQTRIDDSSSYTGAWGFTDAVKQANEYLYDGNGNTLKDLNKGITGISYNMLNPPQTITKSNGNSVAYVYDASGRKLRKISVDVASGNTITTEYVNVIEYDSGTAAVTFIQTEEGRARKTGIAYKYEYDLKDHLGNTRLTTTWAPADSVSQLTPLNLQHTEYYAFGYTIQSLQSTVPSPKNLYLYNHKELQEETGLYDYGARFYDPVIGRWGSVDPLAEKMRRLSPYVYAGNNPIRFIDPDGMFFKPTAEEAAAMATNAYDKDNGNNGLIGGWKRSSAESGITYNDSNTGLNSALYERTNKDGKTEYTYATGGTDPTSFKDLAADALQLFGKSGQYQESTTNARIISSDLKGSELTFTGHSLGGGEAAANALATGRDAITFNAAGLSDATKANLDLNKSAKIDNYDVGMQAIKSQQLIGINPEGTQHPITATMKVNIMNPYIPGSAVPNLINLSIMSLKLHFMSAVDSGLQNQKK